MSKELKKHIVKAAEAHTNLNVWAQVENLLEGGCFYGTRHHEPVARILKIVQEQRVRELHEYDVETEIILDTRTQPADDAGKEGSSNE